MHDVEGVFHDVLAEWNKPSMELHYFPENVEPLVDYNPFIPWL
jgi:hypothetical protein